MPPGEHMSPEEFRRHGHAVVDWVADYLERVEQFPVLSRATPGDLLSRLPHRAPHRGEAFEAMLADVDELILPGITHWQSPNFFAYFPANNSGPSILGELLSAGLGVQGMLWSTSPAATELETAVMDWLVDLLGLPEHFLSGGGGGGVIQDSASSATLCALLAARERATRAGRALGDLRLYASTQAHSSLEKAVKIAGLPAEALRLVEVDTETFAARPEILLALVHEDRDAGLAPFFVQANIGTTSSTAIDPIREFGQIAAAEGLWLHVDAAMSGSAAVVPELRWTHDGVELADSYCFNPHKHLLVNFDCDAFWVRDRVALLDALSILPEYLRNAATDSGQVVDYRDWQIPLGRRFRALKLWFTLRWYGEQGLRDFVRGHVALAAEFAQWVDAHPRFEVLAPVPLTLVCFAHVDGDEATRRIMDQVNDSGRAFLTHTRLNGRLALRLSVGQARTERRHLETVWDLIRQAEAGEGPLA